EEFLYGRAPRVPYLIAGAAFVYSLFAIAGAGQEVVFYGFLLLLAGGPVYVWMASKDTGSHNPG
ncbi:MAG: hypothetical protein ACR2QM_04775, partial [Longimicrobiales bacterium]